MAMMPVPEKGPPETQIAELEKLVQEIEQQRVVLGDVVAEPAIARLQAQITVLKAKAIGDLESAYLRRIVESSIFLRLSGIDPEVADRTRSGLNLTAIYVPLYTTLHLASREGMLREGQLRQPVDDFVYMSAIGALARYPRLVLLGDPGSGKSTFVNYVATCLANARLQGSGEWLAQLNDWPHGPLLPVLVRARDLARTLEAAKPPGTARALLSHIEQELAYWDLTDYLPGLQKTLHESGALLLIDGLDEVPAVEQFREQIRRIVEDFSATFPRCRILVTCRTYAYERQIQSFVSANLQPLSQEQITHFIDSWYVEITASQGLRGDDAQGKAELLKQAIFRSIQLEELARNPMLLTLIASLHTWSGRLPEKRGELYADAVDLLLHRWESPKAVRDAAGLSVVVQPSLAEWLKVDRYAVRAALDQLAFEAHRDQSQLAGTADVTESHLLSQLMSVAYNRDINPARLVEYLRDRTGLLVQRGTDVYTFPHRTFQEYLAAGYVVDHDFPDFLVNLVRSDPARWREVTLLAASRAARGSPFAVWALVEALCPTDQLESEADWMALIIAAEILAEIRPPLRERHQAKQQRIQASLAHLLTEWRLNAHERARAGELLAVLGDPRPGVQLVADGLPDVAFVQIPAGHFLMGSDRNKDKDAYDDEHPQHMLDLPAFLISRYPTTNAQYYAFVADGGCDKSEYWTQEGRAWRTGISKAVTSPEPIETRGQLLELNPRWRIPTQPVVGLSWYETTA